MKVKRIVSNVKTTKIRQAKRLVDDVDEAFKKMKRARFKIEYPLTDEPWGVRRFYVRDPFGKLVNILMHI